MGTLHSADWWVIGLYLACIMGFALWLSRGQHNREDYYVGGHTVGAWPVALSIMATQCSTNSILGAPAFVAFAAGGGLVWLQYELAVPLAMAFLMIFLLPAFRSLNLVSVYGYLETRYDVRTRRVVSGLFMFVRAFATAVTVYSIGLVIDLITGMGYLPAVLILGVFTVVYDMFGGIRGVIYSDVIQLGILVVVLVLVLVVLLGDIGSWEALWNGVEPSRRTALDFAHHGLGDGQTFAFWPMLFGGFFLYVSYYGVDQSQAQRTLSTKDLASSNQALMLNGLLRFPLVALYCAVGLGIAAYAAGQPEFVAGLPQKAGQPEYNLAVPAFMMSALPAGVVGLGLVALFAAAMSSLDSVINSLSATTMEDFVRPLKRQPWSGAQELLWARFMTVIWGALTIGLSFFVGDIAPTVLEAINKVGSLANGPLLGVFLIGLLTGSATGLGAITGLVLGMGVNAVLWITAPEVSWLWWNPIGLVVTMMSAWLISNTVAIGQPSEPPASLASPWQQALNRIDRWRMRVSLLLVWFVLLLTGLAII